MANRLRIYTHNVRYANKSPGHFERPWAERKHGLVAAIVLGVGASPRVVVCLQEVLWEQLTDILELLGSEWTYLGVGREDGDKEGEFAPVLFRRRDWRTASQVFWLSPTPSKPSRGWDAALNRVLVQVQFTSTTSDMRFVLYCTHFDHKGKQARYESAKLVLRLMSDNEGPQFLCGDLNSVPDSPEYAVLASKLKDACDAPHKYGNKYTYTGFDPDDTPLRIDYILSSSVEASFYGVLDVDFAFKFSDHRPVLADFAL